LGEDRYKVLEGALRERITSYRARHAAWALDKRLARSNVAVVALANKLARIAWAVLRRREKFTVGELAASA
jgi:hypothetical protein